MLDSERLEFKYQQHDLEQSAYLNINLYCIKWSQGWHPSSVVIEMMDNICNLPEVCLVRKLCLIKDDDDDGVEGELPYSEYTFSS